MRAALRLPFAPNDPGVTSLTVRDLHWTSPREVVALIETHLPVGGPAGAVVAGFRNGRLAWQAPRFGGFERLVVSHRGEVRPVPADRQQLSVRFRITPSGPADWSPDGRLLVAATRASVYVIDREAARTVGIPLTLRDLAWR